MKTPPAAAPPADRRVLPPGPDVLAASPAMPGFDALQKAAALLERGAGRYRSTMARRALLRCTAVVLTLGVVVLGGVGSGLSPRLLVLLMGLFIAYVGAEMGAFSLAHRTVEAARRALRAPPDARAPGEEDVLPEAEASRWAKGLERLAPGRTLLWAVLLGAAFGGVLYLGLREVVGLEAPMGVAALLGGALGGALAPWLRLRQAVRRGFAGFYARLADLALAGPILGVPLQRRLVEWLLADYWLEPGDGVPSPDKGALAKAARQEGAA